MEIKNILFSFFLLFSLISVSFADVFNNGGDFLVYVDSQKSVVFNDNIDSNYVLSIKNNQEFSQRFEIDIEEKNGWDIILNEDIFTLNSNEEKEIEIKFIANSEFDYSANLISKDTIKFSKEEDYAGNFEFPVIIMGSNENVSIKYEVSIVPVVIDSVSFKSKFSQDTLSPISNLKYSINAIDIHQETPVEVIVELNNKLISKENLIFSSAENYKIGQVNIPLEFEPGKYEAKLTLRVFDEKTSSAKEWYEVSNLEVIKYNKIEQELIESKSLFQDFYSIKLKNVGNVNSIFTYKINPSFFKSFFLGSNYKYDNINGEKVFNVEIKKGEESALNYYYNYIPLYLILMLLVFIIIYTYYRKNSNPLIVETKLYEVQRVNHEGVKSMKIRIGFENIKQEEIDEVKVVFRMPSYLNVKEDSFLLSEPNHVLKGKSQYKLLWDFKRFEKKDSRILGFGLVNKKGILGDIKLPDLEFELKIKGKIKKYYVPFEVIKG